MGWKPFLLMVFLAGWPALLNGQAFIFSDTPTYIKGAAMGIEKATGIHSPWLDGRATSAETAAGATALTDFESSPEKKGALAGRSVYYGAFLLLSSMVGTLWVAVLVQSALALLVIGLAATVVGIRLPPCPLVTIVLFVVLLGGTSLPFFISMLMPDLLAALAILAIATLMLGATQRLWQRGFLVATIALAALSHSSVILIGGLLLATIFVLEALFGLSSIRQLLRSTAWVAAALAVGVAGEVAFGAVMVKTVGEAPIRPPFLTARLLADGPGTRWVHERCQRSTYAVCKFASIAGKGTSDQFIWATDPSIGAFTLTDKATRQALGREQWRFAADVLVAYPGDVLRSTLDNLFIQFTSIGLEEFNYPDQDDRFWAKIPPTFLKPLENSLAAEGRFPIEPFEVLQGAVLSTSIAFLAYWLTRESIDEAGRRLRRLCLWVGLGVLFNALICGALSTPHERYQTRVIWLVVMLSVFAASARFPRRAGRHPTSAAGAREKTDDHECPSRRSNAVEPQLCQDLQQCRFRLPGLATLLYAPPHTPRPAVPGLCDAAESQATCVRGHRDHVLCRDQAHQDFPLISCSSSSAART
jgi:hypothetical protein